MNNNMTSNEFVLWLNGFLDAVSQLEGHQLAKIKTKLKEVNTNTLPDYTIAPNISTSNPVIYTTTSDPLSTKIILKG